MNEITSFTPPHSLNTAVLFLVFNRLDTTKQVFQAIRQAKPPRLYLAADGARESKQGEAENVQVVRDYIMENIDWECDVKTMFRDENLGCKYAVSAAITWFFENEEMGIILEDDCLPSQSFFWFCEELLEKYKNSENIGMISGNNFFIEHQKLKESYFYSYGNIWGWASWKRVWKNYDVSMKTWEDDIMKDSLKLFLNNEEIFNNLSKMFDDTYDDKINTWANQWLYSRLINKLLTINPSLNLVKNIGFGKEATHTKGGDIFSHLNRNNITFPLIHPNNININKEYVMRQYSPSKLQIIKNYFKGMIS
jgi:hypothetical protein